MADRYSFQSPFSRGSGGDPWFSVGSIAVNTTIFITGLGLVGIILRVIEQQSGSITGWLALSESALTRGQLWRFVTYPIPPDSDFFWALLGLLFFYMIGNQFEALLGRRAFTSLIVMIVVIPALLGVTVGILTGSSIISLGLSLPFLGIAAGFAAANPQARSFFNIPFWAIVAFIFVVQLLNFLSRGSLPALVMLISTGALGLIMTRSLGFSNVEWIPSVALPSSMTGQGVVTSSRPSKPKKASRRSKRSKSSSHLQSVPAPTSRASEAEIDALLDQVNEQGLNSLTKQQKQTLERHAQEMRKRRDQG